MKSSKWVSFSLIRLLPATFSVLFALTAGKASDSSPAQPEPVSNKVQQQRLDWNLKTLVEAYKSVGDTNPAWNEPAIRALTEFARLRADMAKPGANANQAIGTNCIAALAAGCKDPMLKYLRARFVVNAQTNDAKAVADAYCDAAMGLQASSYPLIRKFYAQLRAVEQIYAAYGTNANRQTLTKVSENIVPHLRRALSEKTMPPGEAYDASSQGLALWRGNADDYAKTYQKIEEKLLKNWPEESFVQLFKGETYIEMAWHARGGGYANTVTEEGWRLFRERLDIAEAALLDAWKRNSNDKQIALNVLTVARGKSYSRKKMEVWFQRAMELDPNFYQACYKKLLYLEPKWLGSEKAMFEFAWECVESKVWGGHVPLILLDAHIDLQRYLEKDKSGQYWKRPEVWPDLKAAFEKFFKLNPDEIGYHHNYALYAYRCEQWGALNEQLKLLGPVNYSYFGGKEKFDQMVRLAKQHAADSKVKK